MKKRILPMLGVLALVISLAAACTGSTKIVLTASSPIVKAGETVQLTADVSGVTFSLVDSGDFATIDPVSGLITAKSDAPTGSIIKAIASLSGVNSNTVSIAVVSDNPSTQILLTAAEPVASPGETVQLTSSVEGVTFSLVESDANATINATSGLITVKSTATVGQKIKAVATKDDMTSNTVQILIIGTDSDNKILLTVSSPIVKAGETIQLVSDVEGVTFSLLESDQFATINAQSGLITVKSDAQEGSIIKAIATLGGASSNIVSIAVIAEAVEQIVLTASEQLAAPDDTVQLTSSVEGVEFSLIDSDDNATIDGTTGLISIKANATVGERIKAVASKDGRTSNTIQILIISSATEEKILLTSASPIAMPGETVQLTSDVEGVEFIILDSSDDIATVSESGLVSVATTASVGTLIKVVAQKDNNISNIVQIMVVGIPVTAIEDVAAQKTQLTRGESTTLSCTLIPLNTTQASSLTYIITNGYTRATIEGNVLTIASNAPSGDIIIMAKAGDVLSETIVIKVIIPLTGLTISSDKTEAEPNSVVNFSATFAPVDTSQTDVEWDIVSAGAKASISSTGVLTIDEDAENGHEIEVMASVGSIESNIVKITVRRVTYSLFTWEDEITIKNTDTNTHSISFTVNDDKGKPVHGMIIEFDIFEGEDIISLTPLGNYCLINQLTHGTAKVVATLKDSEGNYIYNGDVKVEDYVEVISIKTPNQIYLPDYLLTSISLKGMTEYSVGVNQAFEYEAHIPDTDVVGNANYGACEDIVYSFDLLDVAGNVVKSGIEVGEYVQGEMGEVGQITFYEMGKVRVTATTNSGNEGKERSTSYIFDVNEYLNVNNWEDLKLYLEFGRVPDSYVGGDAATRGVNLVVTQKPAEGYGYSIVPAFVLNNGINAENTAILKALYDELYGYVFGGYYTWYYLEHIQIEVLDKNVVIRGNNHAIDFSKMGRIEYGESRSLLKIDGTNMVDGSEELGYMHGSSGERNLHYLAKSIGIHAPNLANYDGTIGSILNPQLTTPPPVYTVDLTNLKLYGNTGIDGKNLIDKTSAGGGTARVDTHNIAIEIGHYLNRTNFEMKMDNVEIINFPKAMRLTRAVSETHNEITYESKLSNIYINDIYATGIDFAMSQIEVNNITFGFTGAGPFEALNYFTHLSGIDEDKPQTIRFTGKYDPGMANSGNTQYYLDYSIGGYDFHQLMNGILVNLSMNHKNHVHFTGGAYLFAGFSFNDPAYVSELTTALTKGTAIPLALISALGSSAQSVIGGLLTLRLGGEIGRNYTQIIFENPTDTQVLLSDINDTDVNTTARFINMPLTVDGGLFDPKLAGTPIAIGTIYVVNANYTPA